LANAPARVRACLEAQFNTIADRNSCRSPWTTALDLQANLRPNFPGVGRRLQLMVSLLNPLAGLDQLLHGKNDLRGWGQSSFSDPTLLYVRGFNPASNSYVYQVNERFGSNATARSSIRQPFQIGLQAHFQVGPDRQRELLQSMIRGGNRAGGFDLRQMMSRVAPDPMAPIIERRDSLKLTDDQVAALQRISDSLSAKLDSMAVALQDTIAKLTSGTSDFSQIFPKIQPHLQEARNLYLAALKSAEKVLTPEQWKQLPEFVRNPTLRRGPLGGGGQGGQGERRARPPE
jgi:hypothetical protein